MSNQDIKQHTKNTPVGGAIIDEKGNEVPITDDMIKDALTTIKPHSIGWKSGMMDIITDDMLENASKK